MTKVLIINAEQEPIKQRILGFVELAGSLVRVVESIYPHPEAPEHATITRIELQLPNERLTDTEESCLTLLKHHQIVCSRIFQETSFTMSS